jgi:hypothetical protein
MAKGKKKMFKQTSTQTRRLTAKKFVVILFSSAFVTYVWRWIRRTIEK